MKSKFVLTLGDDEIEKNQAKIKNMETGEEQEIQLNSESILEKIF